SSEVKGVKKGVLKRKPDQPMKLSQAFRAAAKQGIKLLGSVKCMRKSCSTTPDKVEKWGAYEESKAKDGTWLSKPTGPICGGCQDHCWFGCENVGTPQEVLQKCNGDKDFDTDFSISLRLRKKRLQLFYPSNVCRSEKRSFMAISRYRGLRPTEFERIFKKSPVEAGRKLQDLLDPHTNEKCKGVLLKDSTQIDPSIGIEYEMSVEIETSETEFKLHQSQQRRQAQAREYFDEMNRPSGLECDEARKLRICSDTYEDIKAHVEAGGVEVPAAEDEDLAGDDDQQDEDDAVPGAAKSEAGGEGSIAQSPAIRGFSNQLVVDNVTIYTVKKVHMALGAEQLQAFDDAASETGLGQKADSATARIDGINLTVIAAGAKRFGHRRVRMEKLRDEMSNSDNKNKRIDAARFTKRLELADIAEDCSKVENIMAWEKQVLEKKIQDLVAADMNFPVALAGNLVARELREIGEQVVTDGVNIEDFCRVGLPWDVSA
ncbi:unnamed protein product, partial [Prorocentrum cordatum]